MGVLEVGAFWGGLGLLVASYRVGGVGGAVLKPKEPPERAAARLIFSGFSGQEFQSLVILGCSGEAAASRSKKPPAPPRQIPRALEAVACEVLNTHSEFRGRAPRNRGI